MTAATSPATSRKGPGMISQLGLVVGRSLFPFLSLTIILGTVLWGPWVTLLLAIVAWKIVTRIG